MEDQQTNPRVKSLTEPGVCCSLPGAAVARHLWEAVGRFPDFMRAVTHSPSHRQQKPAWSLELSVEEDTRSPQSIHPRQGTWRGWGWGWHTEPHAASPAALMVTVTCRVHSLAGDADHVQIRPLHKPEGHRSPVPLGGPPERPVRPRGGAGLQPGTMRGP